MEESSEKHSGRFGEWVLQTLRSGEWVDQALKHAVPVLPQAELSRRLNEYGLRTVDKSAVNKLLQGKRRLMAEEMLAISEITGYPIPGVQPVPTRPPPVMRETQPDAPAVERGEKSRSSGQIVAEAWLRRLMAKVFELPRPQGMTPVLADNLATAILLVCRRPPDQQDSEPAEGQILAQVRALATLFLEPPQ